MSPARFRILAAVLALVVAVASFAAGLALFDDGEPDPAPARADGDAEDAPPEGSEGGGEGEEAPGAVRTEALPSPSFVLVIASERDEPSALAVAEEVATAGHDAGVLRSDDHPSLNPGFWVAYAGPYPDLATARSAEPEVEEAGWPAAYVRCAGTVEACGGGEPAEDDDDEGDDD